MGRKLDDVLEGLGDATDLAGLTAAVYEMRDCYDVEHLVYHSVKSSGDQWAALTYDPTWVEDYTRNNLQTIDPVVLACFNRFTPVDWKRLDWSSRPARALLGEAVASGLGNQGFSLPIHGPSGHFAVFTVNHCSGDESWARFTGAHLNEILLAAHYINERALLIEGVGRGPNPSLSPRETDALTLLAAGRSRAQAAETLRISEHTLRVYIESARFKLGGTNTTHAVANALARGLICL
ncbi:helix-turn-helix transcriptional regulator [Jannaschia seohaensis]|uniref:DNA-binding CsgD family transcriptional regulator n=1 Tax=Jannaschia seohaensis TaxID=475081 RepID=A0A2Y9C3T7_9RHOB|nr:autoinducer binding domain-containing protein [Jannaschia seohaensis]PWJ22105.1 DNA-binding CsgD family transcriptional regulator [Jannaschia seohaensis]SSA38383.1 DNA-binding transcriptional regulator, CsgD family [Jannaschia seohaensis]